MTEHVFREYTSADIPALISLWTDVFGDGNAVVSAFFRLLPEIGTCFVAELEGKIIGMASVLTDLLFKDGDRSVKCAYIYAVATDSRFRGAGIGGTLSRMASDYGKESGAAIISTLPAEEGLYSMYEKTLGLINVLKRKMITVTADEDAAAFFTLTQASPADYNRRREELLAEEPHISVSDGSIEFLKILCRENGGDIFISGSRCASCYVNQNDVFFSELICSPDDLNILLAGGAALYDKSTAYCFFPSIDGEKSVSYTGGDLPYCTVWNNTFE